MRTTLTPIQAQVLEAVRLRLDQGESAPTYRDLCAEFGWRSTGTARDHLRALVRKGYIELSGEHRGLRLLQDRRRAVHVPLVGRVVAGIPVTSDENVDGCIPVPADWTGHGVHFALRVVGDSMRDAGILEGDLVVVRKQVSANDGDIVVAMIDGETTLKRLQRHGSQITLVAENSRYRAIHIDTDSALILGVVAGLLRGYIFVDSGAAGGINGQRKENPC